MKTRLKSSTRLMLAQSKRHRKLKTGKPIDKLRRKSMADTVRKVKSKMGSSSLRKGYVRILNDNKDQVAEKRRLNSVPSKTKY